MRIGVDARPLGSTLTGIGVYLAELLPRLLGLGHEWFLYADRPLLPGPWHQHPGAHIRHGNAAPQSLKSVLIANTRFLSWARSDQLDVFWSPRHHLPFLLPAALPAVVTVHDLVWRRFPATMPRRNRWLERVAMGSSLRKARRVIAVSQFTADELGHFYPGTADRCTVIHEAGRSLPPVQENAADTPYFLFVGTREPRKNLQTLVEAYALFTERSGLPHRLILAGGEGWGGAAIEQAIAQRGLRDRIEICNYVEDGTLAGLYAQATALLMPSLYEGFGLPVVEAMSYGVPVLVSDRAALAEVAGDAGLKLDPQSASEFANAMIRVASDSQLADSLAAMSRRRAGDFSWDRAAAQTLDVLEQVAC